MVPWSGPVALQMLHHLCPRNTLRDSDKKNKFLQQNFPVTGFSSIKAARRAIEYLAEVVKNPSLLSTFSIGEDQLWVIRSLK